MSSGQISTADKRKVKVCQTCGKQYDARLGHGMIDCVYEFHREIRLLRAELANERARRTLAEEKALELTRILREGSS